MDKTSLLVGSAKSMEQDMVVSMVKKKMDKGVKVSTIISDDDTTAISRLRQNINPKMAKISDRNHIRKNFSSSLFGLQSKHKSLSTKVVRYFVKCFNYMTSQNQGDIEGIERGFDALGKHPFGDHSSCSESWCVHLNDATQKYSSLPYGKALHDKALQQSLTSLFEHWKQNCAKLSKMGSSQANESFNKTVSLKAPKNRHYSGSASLNYRVAASVAEKNSGQSYLVDVRNILIDFSLL
jgi:hypothetical protein